MISMLLVAGINSENLANFLMQRGTFTVDFIYNDLHSNIEDITNQIIKVDKLLYLYQADDSTGKSNLNVREDMQALNGLLKNNSFFSPKDIIFICDKSEISNQAKRYFTAVMTECKWANYTIKSIEGTMSFAAVYDNLLGVTQNKDFQNTYVPLYRKERGKDSTVAYSSEDDHDLTIEPFNYDSLRQWGEQKKLSETIEHNSKYYDSSQGSLEKVSSPNFGQVEYKDIFDNCKLILVCGSKGSGKSIWTTALAASCNGGDVKCCVVDLTQRQDLETLLAQASSFTTVTPEQVLHSAVLEGSSLCSCKDQEYATDLCYFVKRNLRQQFDTIFIVTELESLSAIYSILDSSLYQLIITTSSVKEDVTKALKAFGDVKCERKFMILNDLGNNEFSEKYSPEDIKALSSEIRVVKPILFREMKFDTKLYQMLC